MSYRCHIESEYEAIHTCLHSNPVNWIILPWKLKISGNKRGHTSHWAKDRRRDVQFGMLLALKLGIKAFVEKTPGLQFAVVRMTRLAPRALDSDNLHAAFKSIRDGIARGIGIDDGDERVRYVPDQLNQSCEPSVFVRVYLKTSPIHTERT